MTDRKHPTPARDDATPDAIPDAGDVELSTHARFVRGLARALVHDEHAAEDASQDALATAIENADRRNGSMRSWLAGILRNRLRMRWRAAVRTAARERLSVPPDAPPPPAEEAARRELVMTVSRCVVSLPEPYQSVIFLRYYEGLDTREIAARQGAPVATIHTRHRRAVAMLRARLDEAHDGDRRAWTSLLLPLLPAGPAPVADPGHRPLVADAIVSPAAGLLAAAAALVAVSGLAWHAAMGTQSGASTDEPAPRVSAARETASIASARPADTAPAAVRRAPYAMRAGGDTATRSVDDLPTVEVTGAVLRASDRSPVADAPVAIRYLGEVIAARTDDRGGFVARLPRVERLHPERIERLGGSVHARVTLASHVAGEASDAMPLRAASMALPPVLLRPSDATFGGRVLAPDGRGVASATVRVLVPDPGARHGFHVAELVSRGDGSFGPLAVPVGRLTLETTAPGHAESEMTVDIAAGAARTVRVEVRLPAATPLTGRVLDEAGRPVEGVEIAARFGAGGPVHSDVGGRFSLPLAPTTYTSVTARKPGLVPREPDLDVFAGDDVTIVMRRACRLSGTVLLRDGSPAPAGLRVWFQPDRVDAPRWTWTDAEGRYALEDVYPAPGELFVHDGTLCMASAAIEPSPGGDATLDLRAGDGPLAVIEVAVRDALTDEPVAGATIGDGVQFGQAIAVRSGADGTVRLEHAVSTRHDEQGVRLRISAPGYASIDRVVRARAGGVTRLSPIDFHPTANVRFVVTDPDGRPLTGARVATDGRGYSNVVEWTGVDGEVTLPIERSGGETVVVTYPGRPQWSGRVLPDAGGAFEVRLAAAPEYPVTIVGPDGAPLPEAYALRRDGVVPADALGRIPVCVEQHVFVTAPGHERARLPSWSDLNTRAQLRDQLGADRIPPERVVLRPAGPLSGVVLDATGRPVSGAEVEARVGSRVRTRTDGAGRFVLDGLPRGTTVEVEVSAGDAQRRRFHAIAGDEAACTLPARAWLSIEGAGTEASPDVEVLLPGRAEIDPDAPRTVVSPSATRRGGEWVAPVPAGLSLVIVEPDERSGVAPLMTLVDLQPGDRTTIDLSGPRSAGLRGTVRDLRGGPVGGARVLVAGTDRLLATTDAHGTIVPAAGPSLPEEALEVVVVCAAHASRRATVPSGLSGRRIDVIVQPAAAGRGTVQGLPEEARDVQVRVFDPAGISDGWQGIDDSGGFRVDIPSSGGRHIVDILVPGRLPVRRRVTLGRDARTLVVRY